MRDLHTLQPGYELPPLRKGPIGRQHLVEWCAAENDYFTLHYDDRVAQRMALPGTPIQGTYRYALMGQLIEGWMGPQAVLGRITVTYRQLALEGETLTARARVTDVERTGERVAIRLDVWVEDHAGVKVAEGRAEVRVPCLARGGVRLTFG